MMNYSLLTILYYLQKALDSKGLTLEEFTQLLQIKALIEEMMKARGIQ